jgi:hypothetical protein
VGLAFGGGQSLFSASSFCNKKVLLKVGDDKKTFVFLAITAVLGITIFNTLIYFAGKQHQLLTFL